MVENLIRELHQNHLPKERLNYLEEFTDDASVVEAAGYEVHLVDGEPNNIKITTPLDLAIADELLDPPQFSV